MVCAGYIGPIAFLISAPSKDIARIMTWNFGSNIETFVLRSRNQTAKDLMGSQGGARIMYLEVGVAYMSVHTSVCVCVCVCVCCLLYTSPSPRD